MYLPEGEGKLVHAWLADEGVLYRCSSTPWKADYSASGHQFTWLNPPWLIGSPSRADPSVSTKRKRSRWLLKPRKAADSEPLPTSAAEYAYEFVGGNMESVSLYCTKGHASEVRRLGDSRVDLTAILKAFSEDSVNGSLLAEHLRDVSNSSGTNIFLSCSALRHACRLYECLPGATISPRVLACSKVMAELPWVSEPLNQDGSMTRAAAISCIAWFESGRMEISPRSFSNVMAISSGDSLYVAAQLLCDPAANIKPYEIHRVVGNIGRAGLAFLIPPQNPMVRTADYDSWKMVNH